MADRTVCPVHGRWTRQGEDRRRCPECRGPYELMVVYPDGNPMIVARDERLDVVLRERDAMKQRVSSTRAHWYVQTNDDPERGDLDWEDFDEIDEGVGPERKPIDSDEFRDT